MHDNTQKTALLAKLPRVARLALTQLTALLLAFALTFACAATAWAVEVHKDVTTVRIPIVLPATAAIAGGEIGFNASSGLQFVAFHPAAGIANLVQTSQNATTYIGFFGSSNRYQPSDSGLVMGELEFNYSGEAAEQVTLTEIRLHTKTESGVSSTRINSNTVYPVTRLTGTPGDADETVDSGGDDDSPSGGQTDYPGAPTNNPSGGKTVVAGNGGSAGGNGASATAGGTEVGAGTWTGAANGTGAGSADDADSAEAATDSGASSPAAGTAGRTTDGSESDAISTLAEANTPLAAGIAAVKSLSTMQPFAWICLALVALAFTIFLLIPWLRKRNRKTQDYTPRH
jgi:hypothetical protein